jgi:CelD/BcsL family acetyltransferase involved in cellulose biosynthesis
MSAPIASQPLSALHAGPASEIVPSLEYSVRVDTSFDEVTATELWQHAANPVVFNHPAWFLSALAAFGDGRPLRVIRILHGSVTVAFWPLWLKRLGLKEGFVRILEPAGARVTDYCSPLFRAGHDVGQLTGLLVTAAAALLDAQTVLLWPKALIVPSTDDVIDMAAKSNGLLARSLAGPCPAMSLGGSYADLEARWSKSHRGDVRRQIRRLSQTGKLELVRCTSRAEILAMLPRLYAMHTANWRARAGAADLESSPMTTFVAKIAEGLPLDLIDASEVRLDGIAIASHFGFRQGSELLWYKPTFDVAWANYAPGKVHIALAAQHGIASGMDRIDFMQGNEPYKRLWADLTTTTKSFALARPIAYPVWAWTTRVRRFAAVYRT